MKFPQEIFDLIFLSLSRHDLWALSLVSRRFNRVASPTLYKTIIIGLWCGVTLPAKFIRSFVVGNPNHSKIHLVKNVVLLAHVESPDPSDRRVWEDGASKMVNELIYTFLLKLWDRQLRKFIWRSSLNPEGRILVHLANHHGSSLECLYFDKLTGLRDQDLPEFSKFTSLSTLRWGNVETVKDMPALLEMLEASADSLISLSMNYTFNDGLIDDSKQYNIKISNLTEYQTPIHGYGRRLIKKMVPIAQINRFRLTNRQQGVYAYTILPKLHKPVELVFNCATNGPKDLDRIISKHAGNTLKALSICTAPTSSFGSSQLFQSCLSTQSLVNLGRGCPNLVELAVPQNVEFSPAEVRNENYFRSTIPPRSLPEFPLHAFRNLKLLFLEIPPHSDHREILEDEVFRDSIIGESSFVKTAFEAMLDEREKLQQQYGNEENGNASLLRPSRELEVVAIGLATPEFFVFRNIARTPRLWKVIHPKNDNEAIELEVANIDDVMDRDPEWKLLRRYPLLIPNEGLRNIFRRPHLPPSSELLPVREHRTIP
ncbi:hypothetical protein TWF132_006359 [Orbilia oligospora]|nr:hypothetical protein TWF132_006359 [Orbilia oligospora]